MTPGSMCTIDMLVIGVKPALAKGIIVRTMLVETTGQLWVGATSFKFSEAPCSPCREWQARLRQKLVMQVLIHMGGCQNYGPSLGPLNTRCRIISTQKGTIVLTTTHIGIQSLPKGSLPRPIRPNRAHQSL